VLSSVVLCGKAGRVDPRNKGEGHLPPRDANIKPEDDQFVVLVSRRRFTLGC